MLFQTHFSFHVHLVDSHAHTIPNILPKIHQQKKNTQSLSTSTAAIFEYSSDPRAHFLSVLKSRHLTIRLISKEQKKKRERQQSHDHGGRNGRAESLSLNAKPGDMIVIAQQLGDV